MHAKRRRPLGCSRKSSSFTTHLTSFREVSSSGTPRLCRRCDRSEFPLPRHLGGADQLSTVQPTLSKPMRRHLALTGSGGWLSLGAVVAIWPVGRPSQHQLPSSSPLRLPRGLSPGSSDSKASGPRQCLKCFICSRAVEARVDRGQLSSALITRVTCELPRRLMMKFFAQLL